ncbi:HAMP domain-containing histidine kinase [Candidatus Parcubacteria bacterium]|nr:HAMP domain-containing histidine kinase [Candidatus Parcubacteria bacterium]
MSANFLKTIFQAKKRANLGKAFPEINLKQKKHETAESIALLERQREKFIEGLKTEFVSIAAHQLRTPLSAIKWIIRMLLDEDLGPLNKDQKDYLTKAYINNERMVKLINDLLNVSKIEEGRFLNKPTKESLSGIIEEALALWVGSAKRKGLVLTFKKSKSRSPTVLVDKEKIVLVLHNLVENSIKYSNHGEIIIKIDFEKVNSRFVISVKDGGEGIPEEEQEKVFTRFFRASNASKIDTEGTGLGLYIAKHIVQSHGGKIWFESEEGKGTTFYFTLPA